MIKARIFSPRFPSDHHLNPFFAGTYTLGDELGAGGYGFVMTARHHVEGYEVAVKFIIKSKVPDHAWWDDELLGHVPTEVMIMSLVNNDNIVKCLDLFEDDLYFYLPLSPSPDARPNFSRRPSYDLFECIEQSKHKRLSENNARYVFAQVVEAVYYLDSQGITHCDIKDENLVIDADFKVKLIDFGSAVVADPTSPRPFYSLFFGTTAYASSEILLKKPYQAPPAEIWTLGVLLSYLLTGHSPFPTEQDAIDGRMVVRETRGGGRISRAALGLMARCLERDPERRADIAEIRGHRWLQGALERGGEHETEIKA
ncbi:kinase-like domain-containing protein [Irpex rosettiformis]|uniref:Kinase-like domain-containing protein n=1 Tax=Irpex rosettiformis TaxID=378272 RepID=A0ACB8U118_9APHY|nr:kinase-like domain-containing protein [Irpex rosettiformis]